MWPKVGSHLGGSRPRPRREAQAPKNHLDHLFSTTPWANAQVRTSLANGREKQSEKNMTSLGDCLSPSHTMESPGEPLNILKPWSYTQRF